MAGKKTSKGSSPNSRIAGTRSARPGRGIPYMALPPNKLVNGSRNHKLTHDQDPKTSENGNIVIAVGNLANAETLRESAEAYARARAIADIRFRAIERSNVLDHKQTCAALVKLYATTRKRLGSIV